MVHIKICGITNQEDALLAAGLGAHALGFNFSKNKTQRLVTPLQAKTIIATLPPFVTSVGIFTDMMENEILEILDQIPLNVLQFHGSETNAECKRYQKPFIKALHVKADSNISELINQYPDACAILLDTYHPQQFGGTGAKFDWMKISTDIQKPIILAGGLLPNNVAQAVREVRPYAVDVCSGVEISPDKKDLEKLTAFINEVKHACNAKN